MIDCKEDRLTLNGLLKWLDVQPLAVNIVLSGIATDSRKVSRGDLFLALPGLASDGRDYIQAALHCGAGAVLMESGWKRLVLDEPIDVPIVAVDNLRCRAGEFLSHCFHHPSRDVKVFGVTGTNGKTSTAYFLAALLERLSSGCGLMGTLGQGRIGRLEGMDNTTADMLSTQRFIARMRDEQVAWTAMEVSSHALDQGRLDGVDIDTAIFTNLTRDHLDYHSSMEAYAQAKSQLFRRPELKHAVINIDDPWAETMCSQLSPTVDCRTISLCDKSADVYLENIVCRADGMGADLVSHWGNGRLESRLLGRFNLCNILGVIAALCAQGCALERVLQHISALTCVPGRMECLGGGSQPTVVVDYAHTADALTSVLAAIRDHGARNVICLFGCGGDRDRGKRPLMAQAACAGADKVIVTTDNPRTEEPEGIIDEVLSGLNTQQMDKITVIVDRAQAIHDGIRYASAGDIVLIAGKGHEAYQEIKSVRYPFCDIEQAHNALAGGET